MAIPLNLAADASEIEQETALARSLGAVLVGGLISLFLSGAVSMQAVLYYQLYPKDVLRLKLTVFAVWFIDALHSAMTITANWQYLIDDFGQWSVIDRITWPIAVTVALTAIITFFVHCFFIHRIYNLSRRNYYITAPLVGLALVRLIAAAISTAQMIRLKSYTQFIKRYDYIFTIGLATAAALDILITVGLIFFLRRGRSPFGSMDRIIDTITLYTIEDGMLTCVTTLVSLICWSTMSGNLIFLALHFTIGKLYANTLLATLNARKSLLTKSQGSTGDHPLPVLFPTNFNTSRRGTAGPWSQRSQAETRLQVTVEKTIHQEVDGEPQSEQASERSGRDDATSDLSKSPQPPYLPD